LNGPSSMDPDYARGYQVAQAQGHLSSSSARLTVPAPVTPLRLRVDEEVAQPQSWNAENDSVLHAATAESTEMGISLGAGFFVLFAAAFVFCYLQGLPMVIGGMTRIMLACFA